MQPVDRPSPFFLELNDLASNFEHTHDSAYLEKMNSLITEHLSSFAPSEMDQLENVKDKLLKAQVNPKEKIIERIQAISESLRNGLTFTGLSEISDVFIKQILFRLPLHELLKMHELSSNTHSGIQKNLSIISTLDRYASELPIDKLLELATQAGQNLTYLDLSNRQDLTNEHLEKLVELCPNLKTINLANVSNIDNKSLFHLAKLINLQQLNLAYCFEITDDGVKDIATLPKLQQLNLSSCNQITDESLNAIANLTNLEKLSLLFCFQITDDGVKDIATLPKLQQLNLSSCNKITDKGLKDIPKLTNLQQLNLSNNSQITDEGLKDLATLANLQQLGLKWCSLITDEGLKSITKLKTLQQLDLEGCAQITDSGRALILASIPNLKLS